MNPKNILRALSILAYCFILFNGWFISLPFFLILIFAVFDLGTRFQIFCILAIIGLILLIRITRMAKTKKTLFIELIIFILLLSPIAERLLSVNISLFNYPGFIFPFSTFIILYILSLFFSLREFITEKEKVI